MKDLSKRTQYILAFIVIAYAVLITFLYAAKVSAAKVAGITEITGTYITADNQLEDAEYLALRSDGTYLHYKQYKVLHEGTYETDEYIQYRYKLYNNESCFGQILADADGIYLIDEKEDHLRFEKISETPAYINIAP